MTLIRTSLTLLLQKISGGVLTETYYIPIFDILQKLIYLILLISQPGIQCFAKAAFSTPLTHYFVV